MCFKGLTKLLSSPRSFPSGQRFPCPLSYAPFKPYVSIYYTYIDVRNKTQAVNVPSLHANDTDLIPWSAWSSEHHWKTPLSTAESVSNGGWGDPPIQATSKKCPWTSLSAQARGRVDFSKWIKLDSPVSFFDEEMWKWHVILRFSFHTCSKTTITIKNTERKEKHLN